MSNSFAYFQDERNGSIVRFDKGKVDCLKVGSEDWVRYPFDSNYHREIMLGEGLGCLIPIIIHSENDFEFVDGNFNGFTPDK